MFSFDIKRDSAIIEHLKTYIKEAPVKFVKI